MINRFLLGASVLGLAVGVAGCSQPASTSPSGVASAAASVDIAPGAVVNQQVAQLRAATAKYHNLDKALADGYVQITPCIELPGVGGMGYHYGKVPFDGAVSHTDPEVLVYAPNNGQLKLVAVEYIAPQALSANPPSLFGVTFHLNPAISAWVLHAWVWEVNPSGMFEDWNPRISCSN